MNECLTPRNDLLGSHWATWLLWIGPWVLIIVSGNAANTTHTIIWTGCFAFSGTACLINARRCARLHCFYTGPLFLLAAVASLLYGLGIISLGPNGWNWILCVAITGTLLACCGLETLFGKYRSNRLPPA